MANYQIKLTPVETFFFGGDKLDANLVANYFVESNLYPQQTTLLGLMRYYLLLKNDTIFKDNKIISNSNVDNFIGNSSFDYCDKCPDKLQSFGKIKSISPLYFNDGLENYFFAPLDIGAELKENYILEKTILKRKERSTEEEEKLEEFTAKEKLQFITQKLISESGSSISLFGKDGIIDDAPQVGNQKTKKGATEQDKENAFYKIYMKKMKEGWSFAIDVDFDDGSNVLEEILFIPFGGEKCFFKMEVKKLDKFIPKLPENYKRTVNTMICMTDCFLSKPELIKTARFAINEFVSFRNLKSKTSTTKYSALSKNDPSQLIRSNKWNLLKRGAVLYFDDDGKFNTFKTELEKQKNAIQIGFNQFLTIPIKTN